MSENEKKRDNVLPVGHIVDLPEGPPVWTTTQSSLGFIAPFGPPVTALNIIEYEAGMLLEAEAALGDIEGVDSPRKLILRNAVVESALLHARNLCSIFLSGGYTDDIKLRQLLASYRLNPAEQGAVDAAVSRLDAAYGNGDGLTRSIINKMAMHPSHRRSDRGVYDEVLRKLLVPIREIISVLARFSGRSF